MDVLYRGSLKGETPFAIRQLYLNDLKDVLDVQREVVSALENPSTLATLSEEEFQYIVSGNGTLIGVFAEERLIAFRASLVPIIDDEHLGYDIGLNEDELPSVIYQEISNVSPAYRGHGLQRLMADVLMGQLREGEYKYVCATVAPFNIASLKDKIGQEMEVAVLKEKYGDMLRYIFVKNLQEDKKEHESEYFVSMKDTTSQQKLLADGWRGTGMKDDPNGWLVRYEK